MPSPSPTAQPPTELIEAALECFVAFGVRKTSLTDVAARAGVSRATTYRVFGDKDGLVRVVVQAEVGRFMTALDAAVDWRASPLVDALERAVDFTLSYLRQHMLLQRVLVSEPEQLTGVVISQSEQASLIDVMLPAVVERFVNTHHDVLRVPVEQAAEWLIRMTISLLLNPSSRLPDPHTVARLLLNGLVKDPAVTRE
ncbi:MAG: TetR/AcrR family transcriptional regulator [Sciscionella sp.]